MKLSAGAFNIYCWQSRISGWWEKHERGGGLGTLRHASARCDPDGHAHARHGWHPDRALVRERYPEVQVLALTSFEEEEMIQEVMQAGAIGYLQKGISVDELADAIRAAQAGKPTLSPEAFDVLVQGSTSQSQIPDFDLTERGTAGAGDAGARFIEH